MYGNQSPVSHSDPTGEFSFLNAAYTIAVIGILASVTLPALNIKRISPGGKTDKFKLDFSLGGDGGGLGLYGGGLQANICEQLPSQTKDQQAALPLKCASYRILMYGLGIPGISIDYYPDPMEFKTVVYRNATDFEGVGNISFGGYNFYVGSIGVMTVLLPESSFAWAPGYTIGANKRGPSAFTTFAYWDLSGPAW